jgi:hypothetical protein
MNFEIERDKMLKRPSAYAVWHGDSELNLMWWLWVNIDILSKYGHSELI